MNPRAFFTNFHFFFSFYNFFLLESRLSLHKLKWILHMTLCYRIWMQINLDFGTSVFFFSHLSVLLLPSGQTLGWFSAKRVGGVRPLRQGVERCKVSPGFSDLQKPERKVSCAAEEQMWSLSSALIHHISYSHTFSFIFCSSKYAHKLDHSV